MKREDLPTDVNALQELLIEQSKEIVRLQELVTLLQRKKYAPTSEKDKVFNEAEELAGEQEKETITYERVKGKRKPIPADLPRIDEVIDIPEAEKAGMKYIGDEITEKLEITPAKLFVRRIIRKKYAPIEKEDGNFKMAELPPQLLPKSQASASIIAYIIVAKFVDALPLYRQENMFKRILCELTRQTMSRWLIQVSELLVPLYNLLQDRLLATTYIHFDETPTQVLNEVGKKATSKSYMWVRYSPGKSPIVLYDYAPTRAGAIPLQLLEGFKGAIQVDGYDGYAPAIEQYGLIRLGCWDHCRRKFFDASKTSSGKGIGKRGLSQIQELYKIEREISELAADKKKLIRQEKSKPILEKFKEWIDELRPKITPDSTSGKAVNYAFNEWKYLIEYINDGNYNISNAPVENAIRPFCLGKKNWLFSASVDGARASSTYYSLIETAKKNGLEPFDYFSKMLDKLPHAQTVEDYERLLPLKNQFLV